MPGLKHVMVAALFSALLLGCLQTAYSPQTTTTTLPSPSTPSSGASLAMIGGINVQTNGYGGNFNTVTAQLSQISPTNNGFFLKTLTWNWGDCTTSTASDNTPQAHTYTFQRQSGSTNVQSCISSSGQAVIVNGFTVSVTATYADGSQRYQSTTYLVV